MGGKTLATAAIMLSLLLVIGGISEFSAQAISSPAFLQVENALSSPSQIHLGAADTSAFISIPPAEQGGRSYEEFKENMRRRQEENARREKVWQQEKAARGIAETATETPGRYEPTHPLYKPYMMQRARQRMARSKLRAARVREEEGEEEDTDTMYKNTIRACVLKDEETLQDFCSRSGSQSICSYVFDTFNKTGKFSKLKFNPLVYRVNAGDANFTASMPLFDPPVLAFLGQLDYFLSNVCTYNTKTSALVSLFFKEAIDSTLKSEKMWDLRQSADGGTFGRAVEALKSTFSLFIPHYGQLHQLAEDLNTLLVQAASNRLSSPVLTRVLNFACRSGRLCRSIQRELMRNALGRFRSFTVDSSAEVSPALTNTLKETLTVLFDGKMGRVTKNGAAVLSSWLAHSTRNIVKENKELAAEEA